MWCQSTVLINTDDGKRYVRAQIFSDTAPNTMPTNGSGIEGLNGDDILEKGSTFYVVGNGKLYMLNSQGTWVQQ